MMSITEFFSFCGNVTQYAVKNSHFCCLKELGHAVSLFNCSLSNGPCKRDSTRGQKYRKVLTFAQLCCCSIILLIGSISKIYQNSR